MGNLVSIGDVTAGIVRRATPRWLHQVLDKGIGSGKEVRQQLNIPYLGSLPEINVTGSIASGGSDQQATELAESARRLLVATGVAEASGSVIAVTSALPAEGKTTSTMALARSAARAGQRVLLIDCDIRRASVLSFLQHAPACGLLEVLDLEVSLARAVVTDGASPLHILALARPNATLASVFEKAEFRAVLTEAQLQYDLVFLDCAPVLVIADTRYAVKWAQAVVLLVRWRRTPVSAVMAALRTLQQAGVAVTGVGLTRSRRGARD